MAQTLIFSIPAPSAGQDPIYRINWYESSNGFNWTKIDTVVVADLPFDISTGKYTWKSDLSDPAKYHELKTESISGIESPSGPIIPPEYTISIGSTPASFYAEKVETGAEVYNVGDTIDLMLDVDEDVVPLVGNSISVFIVDIFGNVIGESTALRQGKSLYVAEWRVSKLIQRLYNVNKKTDPSEDVYFLSDRWVLPSDTYVTFDFQVNKVGDSPIAENSKINVDLSGLLDISNNLLDPYTFEFTTKLTPFYGNVESVKSYYREELDKIDNIDIAYDIVEWSEYVDLNMRPDNITYPDSYNNAVREYINISVARNLLLTALNTTSEEKQLDALKIKKESNGGTSIIRQLEKQSDYYENKIYAGGLDTPFTAKMFTKGIFDPNRPNITRANLNTNDAYPWVNKTTDATIVEIDGQQVEVRGTRTIQFKSPVFNVPIPNDSYIHGIEVAF